MAVPQRHGVLLSRAFFTGLFFRGVEAAKRGDEGRSEVELLVDSVLTEGEEEEEAAPSPVDEATLGVTFSLPSVESGVKKTLSLDSRWVGVSGTSSGASMNI